MGFPSRQYLLVAAMIAAAPAAAQDAAPSNTPTSAEAPSTTGYSDEQVRQYLKASIAVNAINADASVAAADKPAKMLEAVTAEGIDPRLFNAIAEASRTDAALQQRLQTAMASIVAPTQQN
jgi:hypothetical protein